MYESVFNVLKTKESETRVILNFFLRFCFENTSTDKCFFVFFLRELSSVVLSLDSSSYKD